MTARIGAPPSISDIAEMAEAAIETIPQQLRRHAGNIAFHVQEFPDNEVQVAMKLPSPYDILGLYSGVSINHQSLVDTHEDLDRIFLYRRPILEYWCETGETLNSIIRHVLIHEIGHHFGFSDEDMERIEELS